MQDQRSQEERNRFEAEIWALQLPLTYYRKGLEFEKQVG
jgi:hypothetical protein